MSESSSPTLVAPGISPQTEANLDRFFALSLDLLCIAGLDGYFRRVNPSWTRVLGWSEQELLSRPVADFMHPEDRERTLQARARLAKGIPVIGLENRYMCRDGSYRWLSWQSSLYREGGLVIAVARDITERKHSDEEHLVVSKLESTGMLAAGVAHDFNNLLASVLLNVELVRLMGPLSEQQAQHLRQAQDSVSAAQGLTRQLVTFAEGGRMARRVLDLRPLLRGALEHVLGGSLVVGECDFESELWPAEVEEAQIRQVVKHLARNALEAMPGGGVIRVAARNATIRAGQLGAAAAGNYLCVTVADRGPGIPVAARDKVFDPYFSTKARGPQKGMGLGLTICHAIIRRHGGQIVVDDSAPGAGTTVRCYLPARPGAAPTSDFELVVPAGNGERPRILVMDDEPWLRDVLEQALRRLGYVPELAKDGEEALALFRSALDAGRPFDAVLLDLTVRGGMGGREVVSLLREISPGLRAVLMTGYDGNSDFADYARLGFQAALSKPFTVEGLRATLARLLGG